MLFQGASAPGQAASVREIAARLKGTPRQGEVLQAAKIRHLNLPEVQAQAGANWAQVRVRLCNGSITALRAHLDPEDAIIPCGDGFLIIFAAGGSDVELSRKAAQIEEALTAHYAGEEGLERLRARVNRCVLDSRKTRDLTSLAPAPARTQGPAPGAFPVWSIAAQLVVCYFVVPTHCDEAVVRTGYDRRFAERGVSYGRCHLELDLVLLDAAVQQLATLRETHASGVIGVSVHCSTLRDEFAQRAYLHALGDLDAELRRRFVIKIAEIERGTRVLELTRWVALMRRHARQVALEFYAHDAPPAGLAEIKAWAAGFQAPAEGANAEMQRRWRQTLSNAGMRFFIDNVRSREDLTEAAAHGVDFVTSSRLWPPLRDITAPATAMAPAL